jgi:DNA-binding NtrC family response regulator
MLNAIRRVESAVSPYVLSIGEGSDSYVMAVDDSNECLSSYCASSAAVKDIEFAGLNNPTRVLGELLRRTPDVMLVDLEMPFLDGAQLLRAIRREGYVFPIILAVPPNFPEESATECLRWGASEIIEKPLTISRFMQIISPYINGQKEDASK